MVTWRTRIGRALAQRERNEKQSDDARNAHQQKFAPNSSRMHPWAPYDDGPGGGAKRRSPPFNSISIQRELWAPCLR